MSSSRLPPIAIIGAGLSGLTLALCLKHAGIAAVVYDRAASPPRYNYGVSLRSSTYQPLLRMLHMEEAAFRETLAVNAHQGGSGKVSGASASIHDDAFRCHRGRLETLLRHDLSIKWEKELKSIQRDSQSAQLTARFGDGEKVTVACIVGCDGPHSMARQSMSPTMKLEVLPYVVFNGKRRISDTEFRDFMAKYMRDSIAIQTRKRNILLEISIHDMTASQVDLGYTYSHPARESGDPLHRPDRSTAGATDIPEEFFSELAILKDLEPPFQYIFDVEKVRDDRLLHWLMRSLEPEPKEAERLASDGLVLIGDAVHASPILGGDGANMAIKDGIDLANHIVKYGTDTLQDFSASKLNEWKNSVDDSKRRIREMHESKLSSLGINSHNL